jgi:hypothetical protein
MEKNIIKDFFDKHEDAIERYEEDYGINGRDYLLSSNDIEEIKELLEPYIEEKN